MYLIYLVLPQDTCSPSLKASGPSVQTLCIDKDLHMDAIYRVNTFKRCFFIPKHGILFRHHPPPPQKRMQGYKWSRYSYMQTVTWIFTRLK